MKKVKTVVKTWTAEQLAPMQGLRDHDRNIMIEALAGTGKTAVIGEMGRLCREEQGGSVLYLVFGKSVAEEIKRRFPFAYARTFHSYGWALTRDNWPNARIKSTPIVLNWVRKHDPGYAGSAYVIAETISSCMNKGLLPSDKKQVSEVLKAKLEDSLSSQNTINFDLLSSYVHELFDTVISRKWCVEFGVNHDHCIYLPYLHSWRYSAVPSLAFFDECQDLSLPQVSMAMTAGKRLVFVGDRLQSIYQWRGAKTGVMDFIKQAADCELYPLTTTFRCSKAVTRYARYYAPRFNTASEEQGVVSSIYPGQIRGLVEKGKSCVISRYNSELMIVFGQLGVDFKCKIQGRDLHDQLHKMLKATRQNSLLTALGAAQEKQAERQKNLLKANADIGPAQRAWDLLEAVRTGPFAKQFRRTDEFLMYVEACQSEANPDLVLSTAHQAKGLEWRNVFVLGYTFTKKGQEESNLRYVSVTRAVTNLYWVELPKDDECAKDDK